MNNILSLADKLKEKSDLAERKHEGDEFFKRIDADNDQVQKILTAINENEDISEAEADELASVIRNWFKYPETHEQINRIFQEREGME